MRLEIIAYSKEEFSIQIDFKSELPIPENEAGELLIFSYYTLCLLSKPGENLVTNTLSGLLVSEDDVKKLYQKNPKLPSCMHIMDYRMIIKYKDVTPTPESMALRTNEWPMENDFRIKAIDRIILSSMPRLVDFKGKGKYSFILVGATETAFEAKGFGMFDSNFNYCAFHSDIALIRYLANKHINDQGYLDHLTQVARYCGMIHIFNKVEPNSVIQANAILKMVGVT